MTVIQEAPFNFVVPALGHELPATVPSIYRNGAWNSERQEFWGGQSSKGSGGSILGRAQSTEKPWRAWAR